MGGWVSLELTGFIKDPYFISKEAPAEVPVYPHFNIDSTTKEQIEKEVLHLYFVGIFRYENMITHQYKTYKLQMVTFPKSGVFRYLLNENKIDSTE